MAVGDYNGDGWLDLYVANDATPNQLWINTHNGTFEDQGWVSGAAANAAGRPEGSMGIASGDYDGDGDEDLFVTNLTPGDVRALSSTTGTGTSKISARRAGVSQTTASMTGFGTAWLDYDRDGWLDLITANGAVNVAAGLRGSPAPYAQRNQLFHNEGKGHLVDVTGSSGAAFDKALVSRGLAIGDLDNDGDIDVVISANNGPARILLNESSAGHWVGVRLTADAGNRFGFGARIGIVRQGQPTLWKRVGTDGSYLSASDSRALFGLGALPGSTGSSPNGPMARRSTWTGIQADREVALRRGSGTAERGQ